MDSPLSLSLTHTHPSLSLEIWSTASGPQHCCSGVLLWKQLTAATCTKSFWVSAKLYPINLGIIFIIYYLPFSLFIMFKNTQRCELWNTVNLHIVVWICSYCMFNLVFCGCFINAWYYRGTPGLCIFHSSRETILFSARREVKTWTWAQRFGSCFYMFFCAFLMILWYLISMSLVVPVDSRLRDLAWWVQETTSSLVLLPGEVWAACWQEQKAEG